MATILKDREDARKEKLVKLKELGFEITKEGDVIGYKTFGSEYDIPEYWTIRKGAILEESCDTDVDEDCGSGINFATLPWVEDQYGITLDSDEFKGDDFINSWKPIWKVLIQHDWLEGLVIPIDSDGKCRCEKAKLMGCLTVNHPDRIKARKHLGYPLRTRRR